MIDDYNTQPKTRIVRGGFGITNEVAVQLPDVVQHANGINKPGAMTLESDFGLKVSVTARLLMTGIQALPAKQGEI